MITPDATPGAVSLTPSTAPGAITSIASSLVGSRFGTARFGTARFGGVQGSSTLSITAAPAPGWLTLTED